MHYTVILDKHVKQQMKKIDSRYKARIYLQIKELEHDANLGKPLSGKFQGLRSIRVWPYRIIYEVYEQKLIILIVEIAHRQGVYK